MNEKDRLQKLIDWAGAKGKRRSIDFKIERTFSIDDEPTISIWVYDYDLMYGNFINLTDIENIDKLDLTDKAKTDKQREYEKLKAEFEGKQEAAR